MERTLLIIKPDAVGRNLIGRIIFRLEEARFTVVDIKMTKLGYDQASEFYAVHKGKPFMDKHCRYMSSGHIVVIVLESEGNTIAKVRELIGATDCTKAATGTIRHDLAISLTENSVHASDSPQNAEKEISFFFG